MVVLAMRLLVFLMMDDVIVVNRMVDLGVYRNEIWEFWMDVKCEIFC